MEVRRPQENYFGTLQVEDCDQKSVPRNIRIREAEISQVEMGHALPSQNPENHDFIRFMGLQQEGACENRRRH